MNDKLTPFQRLVMANTVVFALSVLMFLPEEQPYNDTSTMGWALYFAIFFIALAFAIRSWIDYSVFKRQQYRWHSFIDEVRILTDEEYEREFGRLFLDEDDRPSWEWDSEDDPFRDDNEPNNNNKGDK